ncbi:uncharacterized protein [Paramormyrops kingsleyae]|uniref:uncharacterized protein isoform X2 n=1 Tax=Paramormyrops kingsleyae TaxID=1676925 RepID=UPI003B96CCC1
MIKSLSIILIFVEFVIISDGFLLHGSADPLTARLGGAVLLPCFVDRPLPLEELEVDWRRTDSGTIVHLFQDGQSRPESQGDAYIDRAHFFSQEIPKGNFSLLLDGVRTTDAGVYKCVVYTAQEHNETRVEIQELERLVVTGSDESVYAHAGEDVTLSCSVDTHVNVTELEVEWRKTDGDILVLLYDDGENRPESQDDRYFGRADFFTEEIAKGNFSMNLRKVGTEDKGEFRCQVHSDTDSANTTARIAALGYSSLHWLILGLCIAVTPVVLLTGVLSVRHFIRKSKSRQALLCHCSQVAVPPIMVSLAFILWGVTEGSMEEAVTYTIVSLLCILVLFVMAPHLDLFTNNVNAIKYMALRLGSTVVMIFVFVGDKAGIGILLGIITFFQITVVLYQSIAGRNLSRRRTRIIDNPRVLHMLLLCFSPFFISIVYRALILEYVLSIAGLTLGIFICSYVRCSSRYFYLAHKCLLGILFMLYLIISFQYLSLVLENDKGRVEKMCQFVFIYILTVTLCFKDWDRADLLAKPRKYAYFSGAFGLPLLNSVAMTTELIWKANTGKQLLNLRLIFLISGSVFLFGWLVIEISAYCMKKKQKLTQGITFLQRCRDPEPDQRTCDNRELEILPLGDSNGRNTEQMTRN